MEITDSGMLKHRVVHGGDYTAPRVITRETYHHLEALTDLAPLHNVKALQIVRSCMAALPGVLNVACFDSQFVSNIRYFLLRL